LLFGAVIQDRQHTDARMGGKRDREGAGTSEFFRDEGIGIVIEGQAPVLFRHVGAEQTQFSSFLQEARGQAGFLFFDAVQYRKHFALHEPPDGLAYHLLFFRRFFRHK